MARPQATVFGEVAELYHRHRPGYPTELFEWIRATTALHLGDLVLDIGCGTGKSSSWFVQNGYRVIGIEPDGAMAALARRHVGGSPGSFQLDECGFQQWPGPPAPAQLAVSGQAWHWLDPATRFEQVAEALADDAWLVVYWNRPDTSALEFHDELTAVYRQSTPEVAARASALERLQFPGFKAAVAADTPTEEFDQSPHFGEVQRFEHDWSTTVGTNDHCSSVRTQSDHRMLAPQVLDQLVAAIADVIDRHGGSYHLPFRTHAYAAQVRSTVG